MLKYSRLEQITGASLSRPIAVLGEQPAPLGRSQGCQILPSGTFANQVGIPKTIIHETVCLDWQLVMKRIAEPTKAESDFAEICSDVGGRGHACESRL